MSVELWNMLHDGSITKIQGSLPDIALNVEIMYLREMFPGKGESFIVQLSDCTLFEYQPYEESEAVTNLCEIALLEPEMLMARTDTEVIVIGCTEGYLRIRYESFSISLDNGMAITLEALENACKEYWDNL
jgi:hypothetical protein